MNLKIRNILKIKDADLCLDGLTVITGENSSGKSTIGKLLFTLVKALSNTNQENEIRCAALLKKHFESLARRMRSVAVRNISAYRSVFPYRLDSVVTDLISGNKNIEDYTQDILSLADSMEITPRNRALIEKDLLNMQICLKNKDNRAAAISTEMMYSIESEFMNNICSVEGDASSVYFEMDPDNDASLRIDLSGNQVRAVKVGEGDFLQDATYVESPLYLHLLDTIMSASTYREVSSLRIPFSSVRAMAAYHIKDLAEKIQAMRYPHNDRLSDRCVGDLYDVMGGSFVFDKDSHGISFKNKKNDLKIHPLNIASGIKSFGLVQMLLQTDAISPERILIWDEPENHLHPQWQIEFARQIVELVKIGIPIVISTHSPYFIQGLRYFAAKGGDVEKNVKYYLAEENSDASTSFKDVTDDLNSVFIKLAAPLNAIMNVDAARESSNECQ